MLEPLSPGIPLTSAIKALFSANLFPSVLHPRLPSKQTLGVEKMVGLKNKKNPYKTQQPKPQMCIIKCRNGRRGRE